MAHPGFPMAGFQYRTTGRLSVWSTNLGPGSEFLGYEGIARAPLESTYFFYLLTYLPTMAMMHTYRKSPSTFVTLMVVFKVITSLSCSEEQQNPQELRCWRWKSLIHETVVIAYTMTNQLSGLVVECG